MLKQIFPVDAGQDPETLRRHTLRTGEALGDWVATRLGTAASAIVVTLDSTFIRSCEDGERHLEVRVGNVETESGGRQGFGAVARADTDIEVLIRRNLDAVGRTEDTALTAFTDGCPGLRRILADAGVAGPPILDWFHIAMRLQHLKQIASALPTDGPARIAAKAVIVEEVERLHWRIWNGKARNAQRSIDRIRKVMRVFKGERGHRTTGVPSRKLWHALHEVDNYLSSQSSWLVNYAKRYRGGLRRWHFGHRGHGELLGQSANEQVATDALVTTRCRSPAAGSLRRLQRHARFRLRTGVPDSQRPIPANGDSRLTPNLATVPCAATDCATSWSIANPRSSSPMTSCCR